MRYQHRPRPYSIAFVLAACLVAPVAVQTSDFPRQLPQDPIVTGAPPGSQAGSQPVEIVDERWDSVDLRVALLARHRDSRSGEFEQRLANFPSTYTITDVTLPAGK